jgi:flagellar biosynthesis protein FlhG
MPSQFQNFDDAPADQADGLRRLFANGRRQRLVPVAFNAHVDCTPVLLERLAGAFVELGAHTLVIDAADSTARQRHGRG